MTKKIHKRITPNVLLFLLVSVQVLALPLVVLAQDPRGSAAEDGHYIDESMSIGLQEVLAEQNTRSRQDLEHNLYLLYPRALPNTTGIQNVATDFVSCVMGIIVVKLAQSVLRGVSLVGSTVGNIFADLPIASGFWNVGAMTVPAAVVADKKVSDPVRRVDEDGVYLFNLLVGPSGENIAFCAKTVVNAYLTATVIKWINEGFNNAALWVEDLASTLSDVYALSYKKAIGDVNLCIDIEASVRTSVDLDFLKTQPVPPRGGCTIAISERHNLDLMLGGGAYDPGLFAKLYSNPNNNAMGGFLLTTSTANKYSQQNEKVLTRELDWFDGMWPHRDGEGKIVTPGNFIHDKIVRALNLEAEHSALATEWDHVMFMIANQLVKKQLGRVTNPLSN